MIEYILFIDWLDLIGNLILIDRELKAYNYLDDRLLIDRELIAYHYLDERLW